MKISPLLLVISLTGILQCKSQSANSKLLEDVRKKLEAGSNVSVILTDKNYLSLHPETGFRDLIRNHAETGKVSITTNDESGKKINVACQVVNQDGKGIPGAMVYLYQTDSKGWYSAESPHVQANEGDMRHARLFGFVITDTAGKFMLHTVKPSGYPQSDLPAHIHVHFKVDGYHELVTEFLFDDDPRLVGRIREQNHYPIAKPEAAPGGFDQQFSYSIQLQKKP